MGPFLERHAARFASEVCAFIASGGITLGAYDRAVFGDASSSSGTEGAASRPRDGGAGQSGDDHHGLDVSGRLVADVTADDEERGPAA